MSMDDESKICRDLAMIWGVDQREIAKIVHDFMKKDICCELDRINCPPPPIYIGPVKVKSLKERLEETKMKKATSVQNIKNVKGISFLIENHPMEQESKLTIVASTDDDIFEFEFEGPDLLQSCRAAGLFTVLEKDRKIKELKEEIKHLEQKNKTKCENCLAGASYEEMYWNLRERMKKEYEEKIKELEKELGECLKTEDKIRREKNREINELKQQLQQAEHDKRRLTWKNEELEKKISELEALKTPTIENFADEEHSDQPKTDNVNHPSHYETGKFECIEVMQEVFGITAVCDFCKCNAFKYIYRMDRKNGDEDVRKAIWYLNKYLELSEKIDIYKEVGGLIPRSEFVKDGGTDNGGKTSISERE